MTGPRGEQDAALMDLLQAEIEGQDLRYWVKQLAQATWPYPLFMPQSNARAQREPGE